MPAFISACKSGYDPQKALYNLRAKPLICRARGPGPAPRAWGPGPGPGTVARARGGSEPRPGA